VNINATLLAQAIAFVIFVWLCMKYIWPPIIDALEERQKKIADGLSAAAKANEDLDLAKKTAEAQINEAKSNAAVIIAQANERKDAIISEARQDALTERDRILQEGLNMLESEKLIARSHLQKEIADLVILGAEQILERTIDSKLHKELLDNISAKLS